MRRTNLLRSFRRDYRREMRGRHRATLETELPSIIDLLAADEPLPSRCRDRALTGNWVGHRECHIRPNLLLIYRKPDADTLELAHLGSHSELRLT